MILIRLAIVNHADHCQDWELHIFLHVDPLQSSYHLVASLGFGGRCLAHPELYYCALHRKMIGVEGRRDYCNVQVRLGTSLLKVSFRVNFDQVPNNYMMTHGNFGIEIINQCTI